MRNSLKTIALALAAPAVMAPMLSSASDAEISKVNATKLTYDTRLVTYDPMIRFERQYLLHGAIEAEDYVARRGKYFTVFWKAKDRAPGMVVRFEYLQSNTGDTVHVKEVTVDNVKRRNTTDFAVVGGEWDGQWQWEDDGSALTDFELRDYQSKVAAGETIERVANNHSGGNVLAWKTTILRDGNEVDSVNSFLWGE